MILSKEEVKEKFREIKEIIGFQFAIDDVKNFLIQTDHTLWDFKRTVEAIKERDTEKKILRRFLEAIKFLDYETAGDYMIKQGKLTFEDIKELYTGSKIKTTEQGAEIVRTE